MKVRPGSSSSKKQKRQKCIGCNTFSYVLERSYANHKRKCGKKIAAAAAQKLRGRRDYIRVKKAAAKQNTDDTRQESPMEWQEEEVDEEMGSESDLGYKGSDEMSDSETEEMHELEPEIPQTVPELRPSGRPNRLIRLPARYRDELPPDPPPLMPEPVAPEPDVQPPPAATIFCRPHDYISEIDSFGMFRVYPFGRPVHNPDEHRLLSDLVESPTIARTNASSFRKWFSPFGSSKLGEEILASSNLEITPPTVPALLSFAPFLNISVFRLMTWFYNSSAVKSYGQLDNLVNNVILAPDFKQEHFVGFSADREAKRMDRHLAASTSSGAGTLESESSTSSTTLPLLAEDGWLEGSIFLAAPCDGYCQPENRAPKLEIKGLYYRRLIPVIKAAFLEPNAQKYHTTPFCSYWHPNDDDVQERLYHENYCADYYLRDYEQILKGLPEGTPEPIIASLMAYSDSTHLANFGTASLWPIYLFLGNQSKYERGQPTSFAAHHVAYIPKIKDTVQEFYLEHYGKQATREIMTHLRRELMQEVWMLLLDDEFVEAYVHGTKIEFPEDVERLLFPRFNSYGMDYPEKMLVACLKYLSKPLCPRDIILKADVSRLGTVQDRRNRVKLARIDNEYEQYDRDSARQKIFDLGLGLESAGMKRILDPKALTPTRSAFSRRLFDHGFNYYELFAPDLMHEFELGVWKAVFTHLLRMAHAYGGDIILHINQRYRQTPTFGRDTIRRFSTNVSGLKKLAARDYEDILQCSLPVFDGLFPQEHNRVILKLLFELLTWHGLAKLRLHTETTLDDLDNSTTRLGECLCEFTKNVCPEYDTKELPSEEAVRLKRQAAAVKKKHGDLKKAEAARQSKGKQRKHFSMTTYKLHGLGGYVRSIRERGTTDGTSTQAGELEHRRVKRFYCRVRKGWHAKGIAQHVRRERFLYTQGVQHKEAIASGIKTRKRRSMIDESLPPLSPEAHHQISIETRNKIGIDDYITEHQNDPAIEDFHIKLKNHLLSQLLAKDDTGRIDQFSPLERAAVTIINDSIYEHQVMRVNYTTYDLRRDQDSINPRTHPNVQLLAAAEAEAPGKQSTYKQHPYLYARVLGIFHAKVIHHGPLSMSRYPQHLEFILVRWFEFDKTYRGGWKAKRLHRIRFIPQSEDSFGFVNPLNVVRGIHITPAFREGRTEDLLRPSPLARQVAESNGDDTDKDWAYYHVAMFSDRDFVMRYRGGGVGHKGVRKATNYFKADRGILDQNRRLSKQQANPATEPQEPEDCDEGEFLEDGAANVCDDDASGDGGELERVDNDGAGSESLPESESDGDGNDDSEESDKSDLDEEFDEADHENEMAVLGYGAF
ncbi:hypothetical protein CPC08DRAFT_755181 [Agrocybe pediades]|nr:hypothetical protein CPC08DRAFT_755181 [Agrocybe pediades]